MLSATGGPPVPVTESGSMVLEGACKPAVTWSKGDNKGCPSGAASSAGVGGKDGSGVISPGGESRLISVRGILSGSGPSSSARSVVARLDTPKKSCRPRTKYAVKTNTTTYPMTAMF